MSRNRAVRLIRAAFLFRFGMCVGVECLGEVISWFLTPDIIAVLISIATAIFSYLKYTNAKKEFEKNLKNQHSLKYKEIITVERLKEFNKLRRTLIGVIENSYKLCLTSIVNDDKREYADILTQINKNTATAVLMVGYEERDFVQQIENFAEYVVSKANDIYELTHSEGESEIKIKVQRVSIKNEVNTFSEQCQRLLEEKWKQIEVEAARII